MKKKLVVAMMIGTMAVMSACGQTETQTKTPEPTQVETPATEHETEKEVPQLSGETEKPETDEEVDTGVEEDGETTSELFASEFEADFIQEVVENAIEQTGKDPYSMDADINVDMDMVGEAMEGADAEEVKMAMHVTASQRYDGTYTYTSENSIIDMFGMAMNEYKERYEGADGYYERSAETEADLETAEWNFFEGKASDSTGISKPEEGQIDYSKAAMIEENGEYIVTVPIEAMGDGVNMSSFGMDNSVEMNYIMTIDKDTGLFKSISMNLGDEPVMVNSTDSAMGVATVVYHVFSFDITYRQFGDTIELPAEIQ